MSASTPMAGGNEGNEHTPLKSTQDEGNKGDAGKNTKQGAEAVIKKKRQKTSTIWNEFDKVEILGVGKKFVCRYCKEKLSTGGKGEKGGSTSHLRRHSQIYLARRLHLSKEKKQQVILFKPSNPTNSFLIPGIRYSNERMREIIAIAVMVHELPFSIVEDEVWMWAFQYANSEFQKVSRKIVRNDCLTLYEAEKRQLKTLLKTVSKISLTTDMWKSSHQVVEYMVVTGHFIAAGWNLQKRVLSFVKVSAPMRGIDVSDAIFKCLKAWGTEDKVFSVYVDNASYNDSCLKNLKENLSLSTKLVLNGDLFHGRCCALYLYTFT